MNVKDVHINAYMKDLVWAWQANHDIQSVLDAHSCVMYTCDYITKAKKGISIFMTEACKEAKGGYDTKPECSSHGKIPKFCKITSNGRM